MVLRFNKRTPTKEVVLHFLNVLSKEDIKELRKKIFRYLGDHGIVAAVSLELTRDKRGKPNNRVHFHFLLDDPRSERKLRTLFNTACEHNDLVREKDFWIGYRELWDGYRYFNYYTKYGYSKRVILFQKGTNKDKAIQKFYEIGKWFYKSKTQIWDDVKAWLQKKYGTDVEERQIPDYNDNPDENDNENTEQLNDVVPFEMTPEAIAKFNADFDRYCADRDRATGVLPEGSILQPVHEQYNTKQSFNDHPDKTRALLSKINPVLYSNAYEGMSDWYEHPLDDDLLPENSRIRDRRHEWQQFKYSVAFLH
jgi:hypothetical protein